MAEDHSDILKSQLDKANEVRAEASVTAETEKSPEDGRKPPKVSPAVTKTAEYREANIFAWVPKKFEFSSALLPLAKQVSMEAWGWPDYDMSTFLDTYIFHTLKAAGIKVHSWQLETPEEVKEEAEDNGHGDIATLKTGFEQLNTKFDTLLTLISRAASQSQGGK